jgi:hypothetical protein
MFSDNGFSLTEAMFKMAGKRSQPTPETIPYDQVAALFKIQANAGNKGARELTPREQSLLARYNSQQADPKDREKRIR